MTGACTFSTLTLTSAPVLTDLKPFFGAAFSDVLAPFEWWGYLQEDLLLGDLRAFATVALLSRSDVICPYLPPLNSSGVLMLFRNTPEVTYLWRKSRAAHRVLSEPLYLVFDEWWGALAGDDNFARVVGREASAGRLRLHLSGTQHKWMSDDKRYPRHSGAGVTTNEHFVACWSQGKLWGNANGHSPCAESATNDGARLAARRMETASRSHADRPTELTGSHPTRRTEVDGVQLPALTRTPRPALSFPHLPSPPTHSPIHCPAASASIGCCRALFSSEATPVALATLPRATADPPCTHIHAHGKWLVGPRAEV